MSLPVRTALVLLSFACFVKANNNGPYQMPIPYQQQQPLNYQRMYQPQTPYYQQPYYPQQNLYQQPYGNIYPQNLYFGQSFPQMMPTTGTLPQGYNIQPLTSNSGNQRMVLPYGYRIEPLDENDIAAEIPKMQPQQGYESQQPYFSQPQFNQFYQQPQTSFQQNQPVVSVDVVTSSPADYIVQENSYTTKYSNSNTTGIHIVEHKPYNSTIRKVFTTDGSKSGNKVYTINIVNGVEVTTTEDPNAIDYSENGNNNDPNRPRQDLEELEETANKNVKDTDDNSDVKPIWSWLH